MAKAKPGDGIDAGVLVRGWMRADTDRARASIASKAADTALRAAGDAMTGVTQALGALVPEPQGLRTFECDGWIVRIERTPTGITVERLPIEKTEKV